VQPIVRSDRSRPDAVAMSHVLSNDALWCEVSSAPTASGASDASDMHEASSLASSEWSEVEVEDLDGHVDACM
jgi:hypothetical protein